MEKKQITHRDDIMLLINSFYDKVKEDDVIGHIFNEIARVNWDTHLPVMYDFWEQLLLNSTNYGRNAMAPHFALNQRVPLESLHFDRWLLLFEGTVTELFTGEKADLAISRARSIRDIMQFKMQQINHPKL
ncbi:group III truncated hemoglobin [Chitinophaga flava]|uniref:Sec-independent protein translocase TatC n=1 Tax=Chitinophaga flava TaxID=2259036 RepID=A0A365Y316_9BACT|nr:group III truncated hemoglobin [Chitinophaga flava]RBL92969.1 sec-independent protein translocase TatC [Chitinophaga flava]